MMAENDTSTSRATDLDRMSHFVAQLSAHMRAGGLTSLDIEIPEARIRLRSERKGHGSESAGRKSDEPVIHGMVLDQDDSEDSDTSTDEEAYIVAPMIGTFYAAPGPGEPPFVEVGDPVEIGQTIAIIEAMKIMNEIVCDQNGTIAEILVRNADAVEFGQPLFRLNPESA